MKTTYRTDILGRTVLACAVMAGVGLMLLGYAMAGPVVQPANQGTSEDKSESGPVNLAFPSGDAWDFGLATPPEESTPSRRQTAPSATAVPPSSGATSSTGGRQPTTYSPGYSSGLQGMPVPPTYAPGSPGASSQGNANPYGQMPMAPTAYGPYDSPGAGGGAGMAGPGMGSGRMGMAGPGSQTSGGFTGFGIPPSPTSSLGGAAMADPSFGRFDTQTVREATAPRQSATFGQSQSQVLQGQKPFADYRPSSPYSPYLRLNSGNTRVGSNAYYDWVKPALDQQQQNRQVNREVRGLTDTSRAGYQSLESLKQRPGNTIQSTAPRNPGTFMNTGQYYPGLSRSAR